MEFETARLVVPDFARVAPRLTVHWTPGARLGAAEALHYLRWINLGIDCD